MRAGDAMNETLGKPAGGLPEPAPVESSRALVPLAGATRRHEAALQYRQAPFLAHLLAVKHQHAQTRERRRVAPQEAIAAYRATAGLMQR